MNTAAQLNFFPNPQDNLLQALREYQTKGIPHTAYNRFTRSLAIAYKSTTPGATIVGACADAPILDEVIAGFLREVRKFETANFQPISGVSPVQLSAPGGNSFRRVESELFDRYFKGLNSMPFGHRGQTAQFLDFNLGETYRVRTPLGQLVAQLRAKSPSLVIIRNADKLKWPGASCEEIRAAWKLIIDIARQSGVPHMLFTPIASAHDALRDDTLLGSVHLEVLRPYSSSRAGDKAAFHGILNDYNQRLPWSDSDSLMKRADDIDSAIAGDVAGLRLWLIRALKRALSDEQAVFMEWEYFRQTMPNEAQRLKAREERVAANSLLGLNVAPPKAAEPKKEPTEHTDGSSKPPRKRTPGTRKPGRDQLHQMAIA